MSAAYPLPSGCFVLPISERERRDGGVFNGAKTPVRPAAGAEPVVVVTFRQNQTENLGRRQQEQTTAQTGFTLTHTLSLARAEGGKAADDRNLACVATGCAIQCQHVGLGR